MICGEVIHNVVCEKHPRGRGVIWTAVAMVGGLIITGAGPSKVQALADFRHRANARWLWCERQSIEEVTL